MDKLKDIGVVIIGRNEGNRLQLCFDSITHLEYKKVYVDSGSTDSSIAIVKSNHVEVIRPDSSRPFSAARARKKGFERVI